MRTRRNRRHIIVPGAPTTERYARPPRKVEPPAPPEPPDRSAHGAALKQSLENAVKLANERRQAAQESGLKVHGATPGLYIEFEGRPGIPLHVTKLEAQGSSIELVAVRDTKPHEPELNVQHATVFVPEGKVKHFFNRFEEYAKAGPKKKGERRHEAMLDPVATLRLATLRSLWTDSPEVYPEETQRIWWEVWLRRHDGRELERLMEFATLQNIDIAERRLQFHDRIVTLVRATPAELSSSIDVLNDIAELQRAKETAKVFVDMGAGEQADWVKELLSRTQGPSRDAPAACILDTGITRGHPLLEIAAAAEDCMAVNPAWGPQDNGGGEMRGHGTEMAGLALYGDLTSVLESVAPVSLQHRLESVKILPPTGTNKRELYGAITADATSQIEVRAPHRRRCFVLAVTAEDQRDRGQPTSWSAALDALAAGRLVDASEDTLAYTDENEPGRERRLFLVSAGNVGPDRLERDHLPLSDSEPVHDPAQAWNVLTVGAFTERTLAEDPYLPGGVPIANAGDLSPWSTTSVVFDRQWPIKPEVLFEGGNVLADERGEVNFGHPELNLLTTHCRPVEKAFTTTCATSAATAQAARMAAIIRAQYPELWSETVRGLMVHSAEWTETMQKHLRRAKTKTERESVVRRYGYGVPRLSQALRSANNALTLIAQSTIRPFRPSESIPTSRVFGDIQFFHLPWPRESLFELGAETVHLRVTLSYFIEPNPGRRGWTRRHDYASHLLRFEVKAPTESFDEFRKRLNQRALDDGETRPGLDGTDNWYLGKTTRERGSIHSDRLKCSAADLAERGVVAVYPVSGWWKAQPKHDRSHKGVRYALLVSVETEAANVDIWTPVATQVEMPVETVVEV